MGPLIVSAAQSDVKHLLVIGYHGKLVKLAGGIFHTHHHLADARMEILISIAVRNGFPLDLIRSLSQSSSVEGALQYLQDIEPKLARQLWFSLAAIIEDRTRSYLGRFGSWPIQVGSALFDRQRRLRWAGPIGIQQLTFWEISPEKSI